MLSMTTTAVTQRLTETTGLRSRMLTMSAPLAVACPTCNAPAGYPCRTKTGNRPLSYHGPRRHRIAQLPDDDARLRLLLHVYEHLAEQTAPGSTWEAHAKIVREIINNSEE